MSNSNSYDTKSSSFDTLNRELSVRINHPNKDISFVILSWLLNNNNFISLIL